MQLIASVVMMKIDLYISLEKYILSFLVRHIHVYMYTLILWNARNVKEFTRSCERRAYWSISVRLSILSPLN